jgi:hypothetical protein
MILAVPAIGVVKILLSYSQHLRPFVVLLEDKGSTNVIDHPVKETEEIKPEED